MVTYFYQKKEKVIRETGSKDLPGVKHVCPTCHGEMALSGDKAEQLASFTLTSATLLAWSLLMFFIQIRDGWLRRWVKII